HGRGGIRRCASGFSAGLARCFRGFRISFASRFLYLLTYPGVLFRLHVATAFEIGHYFSPRPNKPRNARWFPLLESRQVLPADEARTTGGGLRTRHSGKGLSLRVPPNVRTGLAERRSW